MLLYLFGCLPATVKVVVVPCVAAADCAACVQPGLAPVMHAKAPPLSLWLPGLQRARPAGCKTQPPSAERGWFTPRHRTHGMASIQHVPE